ncbi:unnamed protein product [Adineta steineri]|uniref:Uncharacterized protein n=1 Tax=Adineta steineri TaxID=433720 RepID=A0A818RE23_9BILA|nr:unnamed protein product [Adineta steineri]CAF1185175.1 unnamed protein product [Adineta steineri]CAF3648124.1 unnamed protein product [Adineta steineri]CAF4013413.1 unnamed protein product [Adineta steineri]
MSIKKTNDKDIFRNVVDIGLRMYGDGHCYPSCTVDYITEYCRQQLRLYILKHKQLMKICNNNRISFLNTLVYTSRHKKACIKRLQQFVQTKDRSITQQEELNNTIIKDKKLTITSRFTRICRQLHIPIDNNNSNESIISKLDHQRSRQYARLDAYYKSDELTANAYLLFVEKQHSSFNSLRSLSSIDIFYWLNINDSLSSKKFISNQDLRLAEICLFLIKEILLNLMDKVFQSSIPCQIQDIFRRQHVQNNRRLLFSGRKRIIH